MSDSMWPLDSSMRDFSAFHYLLEYAPPDVHWVSDAIQPSHPVMLFSPAFNHSQYQSLFPVSQLFASSG